MAGASERNPMSKSIWASGVIGTLTGLMLAGAIRVTAPPPPPSIWLPPARCPQIHLPPPLEPQVAERLRSFEVLQRRMLTHVGRPMPFEEFDDLPAILQPEAYERAVRQTIEETGGEYLYIDCDEFPCIVAYVESREEGAPKVTELFQQAELEDFWMREPSIDPGGRRGRIDLIAFVPKDMADDPRAESRVTARLEENERKVYLMEEAEALAEERGEL